VLGQLQSGNSCQADHCALTRGIGGVGRLCQLSRHEGEAGYVDRSDLDYAAAIIPINWTNRSRWMRRRCVSERRWV
jgi:hypothetical protein